MSTRLFAAIAFAGTIAIAIGIAPAAFADPATANAPSAASVPTFPPGPLPTDAPTVAPTPVPTPPPSGKHGKSTPAPTPTPTDEPTPVPAPTDVPTAAPTKPPVVRGRQLPGFVYLRDRYRRDDQGAALRKPIKELADLNYMLGTWSAHIFTLTSTHKITHDFGRTTYIFARTMNDRWILGTDAKNTEYLYFTYDPPAEHWVYNDIKGFPSYGLSYATGDPHHLEFDAVVESALGDERHLRTTLTYTDPKHFSLLDEELTPDDQWTPVVKFDFTKL